MGSCLSAESRSPRPGTPSSPGFGARKRKNSKKRPGSRNSSFDYRREEPLHRIPGRLFLNGSSEIASLFTQQGKKGTNQDAMVVWENFGPRSDSVFCGVFDGHGPYGHMVAKKVRDHLPLKLSAHLEVNLTSEDVLKEISLNTAGSMNSEDISFVSADEESRASVDLDESLKHPEMFQIMKESFLKAFKVMDRELRMHTNIDCFCSGTTAVTLIKQGQNLVVGNVGDSRAILGTRDKDDSLVAVQLTVDLKPNLPAEAERIRKCKGRVFALHDEPEVSRVWLPNNDSPGLAMARAFGDFCLKDYGLISVPDISFRRLSEKDVFLVLATDGVKCVYRSLYFECNKGSFCSSNLGQMIKGVQACGFGKKHSQLVNFGSFTPLTIKNFVKLTSDKIWDVLSNKEVVDIVASVPAHSSAARAVVETAVRAWRYKYPTSKVDDCAVVCLFLDSNNVSTASNANTNTKEKPAPEDQADIAGQKEDDLDGPTGLVRSGTVRTGKEVDSDGNAEEDNSKQDEMHAEYGIEWSALEGVSRVNTLLNLPRFVPGKEDKKSAGGTKARK